MIAKLKPILLITLGALVVAASGCNVINTLRAKNSLNEGVHDFNKGSFEDAEKKFERALELSPDLPNARLFHARAINARFDQALTEDLGMQTIKAYDDLMNRNKDNLEAVDQSLAFQAAVYDKLTGLDPTKAQEYKQKQRETLLRRAELASASVQTKADVYYTIGVGYWKESYELNYQYAKANQTIPSDVLERMKPHVQRAHEYLQKAISVKPDYANAWFYESLVYIEDAKTEQQDAAKRKQLLAHVDEYRAKYIKMQKEQAEQTPSK
ncbi:MAG TPA: hypothetical protein VJH03_19765 [Blastocatellia bacterium]|nr:hypothetical protein [Blastocatellia bacterium]